MSIFTSTLNTIMWYALIVASIVFCVSSLDDLFFDIIYWFARIKSRMQGKKPINYSEMASIPEKRIALMIPCWHEYEVIKEMLSYNLSTIDYKNYDIFVGLYPNDPYTRMSVQEVQREFDNLYYVINPKEGPTTKSDNLNSIYSYIRHHEEKNQIAYDVFVMHDAEDIIHPLSLKLYNYEIDHFDMIQTPVFPLEVQPFNFTHWIYNDEFAEIHQKSLVARKLIRGLVPSAGVGTAFSQKAINMLILSSQTMAPFSLYSVVEDYDAALRLQQFNLKTTFIPFSVSRIKMKPSFFGLGRLVPKEEKQIIATRELFPTTYAAALKQRTRWVYGITLQEWAEVGWTGTPAIRFTLAHDRKSIMTHFLNGFGYVILLYWFMNLITNGFYHSLETLPELLNQNAWVYVLIVIATIFMLIRITSRMYFTYLTYDFWSAILSVPRVVYANLLNIHTSYAAMKNFFLGVTKKKKVKWVKTSHVFPTEEQLKMYKRKVGDIMLDQGMISARRLKKIIQVQAKSADKIGEVLLQHGFINLKQLTDILAQQSHLHIIDQDACHLIPRDKLDQLPPENYQWLLDNKLLPVHVSHDLLTIAVFDPIQLTYRDEILEKTRPYRIKFVLISLAHKLGDILVARGLVTPQQVASCLADQFTTGKRLGSVLVSKGYITQEDLTSALAQQYNLNIIDLSDYEVLPASRIPYISNETYNWLIKNNLLPISCLDNVITLVIPDPADEQLKKEALKKLAEYDVNFVLAETNVHA